MDRVFTTWQVAVVSALILAPRASAVDPSVEHSVSADLMGAYSVVWTDKTHVAVGGTDRAARLVDVTSGQEPKVVDTFNELAQHSSITQRASAVLGTAWDPTNNQLILAGTSEYVEFWSPVRTPSAIRSGLAGPITMVAVERRPSGLVAVGDGKQIAIFRNISEDSSDPIEANAATLTWLKRREDSAASSIASLIVGLENGGLRLHESPDFKQAASADAVEFANSRRLVAANFSDQTSSPTEEAYDFVTADRGAVLRKWTVSPVRNEIVPSSTGTSGLWYLARDGSALLFADSQSLRRWKLEAETEAVADEVSFDSHMRAPLAISSDDKGESIALLTDDAGGPAIWLLPKGGTKFVKLTLKFTPGPGGDASGSKVASTITVSPDGKALAVGFNSCNIFSGAFPDAAAGPATVTLSFVGREPGLRQLCFAGGVHLCSLSCSGSFSVWRATDRKLIATQQVRHRFTSLDVMSTGQTGKFVVAAGCDATHGDITLYMLTIGEGAPEILSKSATVAAPGSDRVRAVHLFDDGARLVAVHENGDIRMWDTDVAIESDHVKRPVAGDGSFRYGLCQTISDAETVDGWGWNKGKTLISVTNTKARFSRFWVSSLNQLDTPVLDATPVELSTDADAVIFTRDSGTKSDLYSIRDGTRRGTIDLAVVNGSTDFVLFPDPNYVPSDTPATRTEQGARLVSFNKLGRTLHYWNVDTAQLISSFNLPVGVESLHRVGDGNVLAQLSDHTLEALDFVSTKRTNDAYLAGNFKYEPPGDAAHQPELSSVALNRDSYSVLAGYSNGMIARHVIGAVRRSPRMNSGNYVNAILLDDKQDILIGVANGRVGKWILEGGKCITSRPFDPDVAPIYGLAIAPKHLGADRVFVAGNSPRLALQSLSDPAPQPLFSKAQDDNVYYSSVAANENSSWVVACQTSTSGTLPSVIHYWPTKVWKMGSGDRAPKFLVGSDEWNKAGGEVFAIAFSPDGKRFAAVKSSGLLQIWKVGGDEADPPFTEPLFLDLKRQDSSRLFTALAWAADGQRIAITSTQANNPPKNNDATLVIVNCPE